MPRVKRGKVHLLRRKNLLKQTKGYMWGRKSKIKLARVAVLKAGKHAYRGRKLKKRQMRGLHQTKINAAARLEGVSYSKLIDGFKKAQIHLDRKILAQLAEHYPTVFKALVHSVKK